jgi:hypothetical protein
MNELKYTKFNNHINTRRTVTKVEIVYGKKAQEHCLDKYSIENKIGVLIAGNAGRPGGGLGKVNGSGINMNFHKTFNTHEEDVLASWLQGEEILWNYNNWNIPFNANIIFSHNLGNNIPEKNHKRPWV